MADDRLRALQGKYLSLGAGELMSVAVFTVVALVVLAPRLDDRGQFALWCALLPLLVVLVQGGAYWLLARRWVLRAPMPAALAALYRGFRVVDVVLLVVGLVGVLLNLPSSPGAVLLVLAVWLFALVEYVNYFVARLSYPLSTWLGTVGQWRTPRIVLDLRASTRA